MKISDVKIALPLVLLIILAFTTVKSEIKPPVEISNKLLSMYQKAAAIEWEMEHGNYEAELTVNGYDVEITFDKFGNVIECEEEIPYTEIHDKISIALEKEKTSYKITKVLKRTYKNKTEYNVVALFPGSREHITLSENGSVLSRKVMAKDKVVKKRNAFVGDIPIGHSRWDLPVILTEISGIAFLGSNVIACVQDELGSIFLFDLMRKIITAEIEFASSGDYEGIAIVNNDAYVLRSDGVLFEVSDFQSQSKKIKEYKINLPKLSQNFEGLCYDIKGNRLLLAPRAFDSDDSNSKGIYAFNLSDKIFSDKPVFSIKLTDPIFAAVKKTGKNEVLIPSEIAIHPVTDDVYISDARNKQVLVLNRTGVIKSLHQLSSNTFPKTEGIAITSDGELYLSNEGKKSRPNIIRLSADKFK